MYETTKVRNNESASQRKYETRKQRKYETTKVWNNKSTKQRKYETILNLYAWAGIKHFVSLELEYQSGVQTRDHRISKQAALPTVPGPPPNNEF